MKMINFPIKVSIVAILFLLSALPAFGQVEKSKSSQQLWDQIASDTYELPYYQVSFASLLAWGKNKIDQAAERTLNDRSDILDQFTKLAHPNGICFKGKWEINQANIYSGLFREGTRADIIVRASTALSETKRGDYRAFGFAGKVFSSSEQTANFFLIDDLGGTLADHYTDVELTNEPKVSTTNAVIKNLLYALKLASSFSDADRNPGIRQLYELSEAGETNGKIITPKWMKVKANVEQTINEDDFRDELRIDNYSGALIFDLYVANQENTDADNEKNWQKIGKITLEASVVSNSCDHRLHFHHPKWRDDLNHQ